MNKQNKQKLIERIKISEKIRNADSNYGIKWSLDRLLDFIEDQDERIAELEAKAEV